jgi:uncharacterized protein (DUF885 family)
MRCAAVLLFAAIGATAQAPDPGAAACGSIRAMIESLRADLRDLQRRYDVPMSGERRARLRVRYEATARDLQAIDFERLGHDDRVDWLLLDNHVRKEIADLELEAVREAELANLLPFADAITQLAEARRRLEEVAAADAATIVDRIAKQCDEVRGGLGAKKFAELPPGLFARAATRTAALRQTLRSWFEYRDGYDPGFGWWLRTPHGTADEALGALYDTLTAPGNDGGDRTLLGDPIGAEALQRELAFEWIPYQPAELVAIAEREFAWCDTEMAQAATAMGCKDWREALERVKQRHREPGRQPELIRDLAHEAITFLEQRDLITIPPLAKECWRMRMMSREAQKVNPFFLGGETIQVSFPTDAMAHIEKLQALRSNNEHFCRATVHHELIPGHWLQEYSQARHRTWREPFDTPFWIEGWALYWEMRMYDLGLAKSPEDKVGMLYWRKHRCARIVFSLRFHLGEWTGPQCVEYLIDRVGHERAAAEGEVRRSVGGAYPPLYQAAYMLGGLQLRALHHELVDAKAFTERQFHDAILTQNSIPIAVLRAALGSAPVPKTLAPWRFAVH